MNTPRIFLCGITSSGKESNLRALIEPISEHIHGLQWCFHYPKDEGADYLESRVGEGRIVYSHFSQRHGFSMTQYLWQGTMRDGDICLQLDDLERISPKFMTERLPGFIALMEEANVAMIANYGKGFIYRYNEQLEFRGSPHWYATNLDGQAINVELDKSEFWNVRGEQRDAYQWVTHYAKYHLYPAGSNSALLGLEKQGDPQVLFPKVETRRLEFRKEMVKRGYPLTVEGMVEMFQKELDTTLKTYINESKELNDVYRYYILSDKTVVDTHRLEDMKRIE